MVASKILFWEKLANKPEKEEEDKIFSTEIQEDKSIRDLIRDLESKIIGKKRKLSELSPSNSSIKKWVNEIISKYPEKDESRIDDVLNEYRAILNSKSREKEKFIIAILQLNDVLLIVHCKKGPSLAELKNKIFSVQTILNSNNIIRADIIKREEGLLKLLAYEKSRKLSKGHARFWGIEIEDVGWDSLGNISLNIELESVDFPVQITLDNEQLKEMINNKRISPSGKISLGREEGVISKVYVYNKVFDYSEFYDFFVTETEKLDEYKKKFNQIVPLYEGLNKFIKQDNKHKYEEDKDFVYEIKGDERVKIVEKNHQTYNIIFSTKRYPVIKPRQNFLIRVHDAIFNNTRCDIYHAGEDASKGGLKIGNLIVYNNLKTCENFQDLSDNFINKIQDAESTKLKLDLKISFCYFMKNCINYKHFGDIFDYLIDFLITELEYEFQKTDGITANEEFLEFKSAESVNKKPTEFAKNTLAPTIKKYIDGDSLTRNSIIYGVEDDHTIKPLYHFQNDMATTIKKTADKELEQNNILVNVHPIKYKEGTLLLIIFTKEKEK